MYVYYSSFWYQVSSVNYLFCVCSCARSVEVGRPRLELRSMKWKGEYTLYMYVYPCVVSLWSTHCTCKHVWHILWRDWEYLKVDSSKISRSCIFAIATLSLKCMESLLTGVVTYTNSVPTLILMLNSIMHLCVPIQVHVYNNICI